MKILQESFKNLTRNRLLNLASIISIGLILAIFSVLLSVNQLTKDQIEKLSDKISLNIYLENNVTPDNIQKIHDFLQNLPEVESVKTITKEEALAQIQSKYPDSSNFLNEFNIENPLPNNLQVKTYALEDNDTIINILQKSQYQNLIFKAESKQEYNETIKTVITNLIKIKNFSFQILLWVIITFVLAGSLIMFNAIHKTIFTRRNEIQIMQFVGASFKRIILPFVAEGALIGFFGFLFNLFIISLLNIIFPFSSFIALFSPTILLLELLISCGIGILTSAFVVNKYLNTRDIICL